jgi:beta-glucosidase
MGEEVNPMSLFRLDVKLGKRTKRINDMEFPADFAWGVAAASYQIEGAAFEEGKGLSIWDMLCRKEGAIWNGQSGDVACDHYHHYKEDVALMKSINIPAYRLSISWPRILPGGTGKMNPAGLDFYDRLIDELLAADITPYVTLFHWDYPYELHCRGGWLNPDSSNWFAEYTKVVASRLGDRVSHWMTHNEPHCFIGLGYQEGRFAPGIKMGLTEVLLSAHNVLLAHGKGVQAIRASAKLPAKVGIAMVGINYYPTSDSEEDIQIARQATYSVFTRNLFSNTWWLDPIFFGHYPEDGQKLFGPAAPEVRPGDMETIRQPIDFLGENMYTGSAVRKGSDGTLEYVPLATGHPLNAMKWPLNPEVLHWGPIFLYERYKTPIIITENGSSEDDWISLDGKVHDPGRIDYTHRYLLELHKAIEAGVPVKGYFHWSIMDNFEWAEGYKERLGLIFIDYPTQKRILKDSAYWYQKVITSNGESLRLNP